MPSKTKAFGKALDDDAIARGMLDEDEEYEAEEEEYDDFADDFSQVFGGNF